MTCRTIRGFVRKMISYDRGWASFDCLINRISEYSVIQRCEVLKERVAGLVANRGVLGGPFEGMRYGSKAFGSFLWPKLLGTYETEIQHIVMAILQKPPEVIVDIGCAEGYYAVGFALKCPAARIVAFDTANEARELTTQLAAANGVLDRMEIHGHFSVERFLQTIPGNSCFILCDTDGAEREIFHPDAPAWLKNCSILIETHDGYVDGITECLLKRFVNSHNAEVVESNCDYKVKSLEYKTNAFRETNRGIRAKFFEEGRPFPQKWIFFTPRI